MWRRRVFRRSRLRFSLPMASSLAQVVAVGAGDEDMGDGELAGGAGFAAAEPRRTD